jgi:hypothetical protein
LGIELVVQQVRKCGEGEAFGRRFAIEPSGTSPELHLRHDKDDVNDAS